ncbi:uncharacterized protein BO95DRAFT_271725 [Aspergillus brunneoviolaceus CBS 621.78]|uniref:Uncharacterized protein n=1 Tax=Aspergillus brunneoviolaceus CBS 621.78 TaxID=1450534 RepID=A0ACD1FWN4_9EURO|nr:hypothetical protein BO95DRAFT_271725 [Aspergillus brunneoviolaceus CBS 621.78]RAH41355.1 hypothetical protein BO95DRAFT_271725 [Aspergillus brunneoviolaceus CBS 621.78]
MQNARTCSPSSFLRIHTWLGPHSLGQELPLLQQTVWICPSYRLWLLACSQSVLPRCFPAQTRRLCRITGVHCSETNVSFLRPIQVDRHTISCQHTFEGACLCISLRQDSYPSSLAHKQPPRPWTLNNTSRTRWQPLSATVSCRMPLATSPTAPVVPPRRPHA